MSVNTLWLFVNISMFYKLPMTCKDYSDNACWENMKWHINWTKIEIWHFFIYVSWWSRRHLLMDYMRLYAQLPHSYYFTTRILVLKFMNKGVFFLGNPGFGFPRKRGYFGTHLREFGEKGVILYVQCFTVKRWVHLGWQVSVLRQKGVHFGLKSQYFIAKKGSFWAEKSVFCHKKKHFSSLS